MNSRPSLRRGLTPLLITALAGALAAQPIDDRIVVAARGSLTDGPGGLFLVRPTGGGQTPTTVTGLPSSLTGEPLDATADGASGVHVLANLDVLVGNAVLPGGAVELFRLTIDGATATIVETIAIGTNTGGAVAGVQEIVELPNGDLLVVTDAAVTRGSGAAAVSARATLVQGIRSASPTVSAFPVTGLPAGDVTGVGVEPVGGRVFLAVLNGAGASELHTVPIAGGAATFFFAPSAVVTGLTIDPTGQCVVSTDTEIQRIDVTTVAHETIRDSLLALGGVAILPFNDRIMLLRRHPNGENNYRVSTMRSKRRSSGFSTLTNFRRQLGEARDLAFAAKPPVPPPPPPPPRLPGNPGGNVLVAAQGSSAEGRGGLFLLNPTQIANGAVRIQNLPDELTGLPLNGTLDGAQSVFVRQGDQRVFVGSGNTTLGEDVFVFEMTLDGDQATVIRTIFVGTHTVGSVFRNVGGVQQIDALPDGTVIAVSNQGVTRRQGTQDVPVFASVINGGISLPLRIEPDPPAGDYQGVAVDNARGVIFMAVVFLNGTSRTTDIISVPIDGGTFTRVARIQDESATGLALDNDNQLLVATIGAVFRLDPDTGIATPIQETVAQIAGVTNADPTGEMVIAFAQNGDQVATQDPLVPNGPLGFLTRVGESMGRPQDLHLLPSPHLVANGTPGQNSYSWAVAPNPGGMAFPGASNFSLTLASNGPNVPLSVVFLGSNANPITLFGVSIFVDLLTAVNFPVGSPTPSTTIPLPIPNSPAFINFRGFAQAVVLDPAGLASSDAVTFRVL
ncbi:MAG: hypothetical protein AAF628_26580 [Planctomycetota bacterium]